MREREQGQVVPLWFLNDQLEREKLTSQLEQIKRAGVNELVVHPRYGLPDGLYLSREWFSFLAHILDEASRLQMGIWIYDDLNWPSGTAGGALTQQDSSFQEQILGYKNGKLQPGLSRFEIAYQHSPFVDVLSEKTVWAFIQTTHAQYLEHFGNHFGQTIPGFFTDEPGFHAGYLLDTETVPFTDDLLAEFKLRRGYDPQNDLLFIWGENGGKSRRIRQDYWQTVSELYQERYLGPLRDWCHRHGVLLIGHLLEEEDPLTFVKTQADPFAALSFFDWSGYDLISSPRKEDLLAARLAYSVARIYQKSQVMAETMGAFGWEMKPEMMVRLARWHAQQGTTVLAPHALFYSIREDRRFESPPSLFEEPYWSNFPRMITEFRNEAKRQVPAPETAIYFPLTALWSTYNPSDETKAREISETVRVVSLTLGSKNIPFIYLNDKALEETESFSVRKILLPRAEVLPLSSLKALEKFLKQGGRIVFVGSYPKFASKDSEQQEFEEILCYMKVFHFVDFLSLPVKNLRPNALLQEIQYRLWHNLSCISPRYATYLIGLKHLLLKS